MRVNISNRSLKKKLVVAGDVFREGAKNKEASRQEGMPLTTYV